MLAGFVSQEKILKLWNFVIFLLKCDGYSLSDSSLYESVWLETRKGLGRFRNNQKGVSLSRTFPFFIESNIASFCDRTAIQYHSSEFIFSRYSCRHLTVRSTLHRVEKKITILTTTHQMALTTTFPAVAAYYSFCFIFTIQSFWRYRNL